MAELGSRLALAPETMIAGGASTAWQDWHSPESESRSIVMVDGLASGPHDGQP